MYYCECTTSDCLAGIHCDDCTQGRQAIADEIATAERMRDDEEYAEYVAAQEARDDAANE